MSTSCNLSISSFLFVIFIFIISLFQVKYPENFFLLRGNHVTWRRFLMPVFIQRDISGWSRRLPVWILRRNMLRNLWQKSFLRNVLLLRGSMDSTMSANAGSTSNCGNNSASWWHKAPWNGKCICLCTIFTYIWWYTGGIQNKKPIILEWNGKG